MQLSHIIFIEPGKIIFVQPCKWFAEHDKHYRIRSGQISLTTAGANFTKPRTSHFFGLCIGLSINDVQNSYCGFGPTSVLVSILRNTEIGKKVGLFAKLKPGRARKRINAT